MRLVVDLGRRLTREEAVRLQKGLGLAGLGVGLACLLAPRTLSRIAGLPGGRRDAFWARLFGVRELAFSAVLATAPDRESARLAARMVAVAQVGDLAVSTLMLASGTLPFRAWLSVALAAPPTYLAATAVADNLRAA